MKLVLLISLVLACYTANATIESFLKEKESVTDFPVSFFWKANTTAPTGVPADIGSRD